MSALDLDVPIVQAPVGGAATARLAAEVSRVGGLGWLGASWTERGVPREQIRSIGRAVNLPRTGMEGDVAAMAMYAGQSVGAITEVEPAAAIVECFAAALRNG